MGFPLPLWPSPCGWPLRSAPRRLSGTWLVPDHPLLTFRSPPESGRSGAAAGRKNSRLTAASLAVCSPSTSSRRQAATHPGIPAPGTLPPQRFSRSRGLVPPGACRPSFMPVPSLGLHPSGPISARRAGPPSGGRTLLRLALLASASGSCSLPASFSAGRSLARWTATLLGFSLPGDFSLSAVDPLGSPLLGLAAARTRRLAVALQSVPAERWAGLSRACRPLRGLPPRREPAKQLCRTCPGRSLDVTILGSSRELHDPVTRRSSCR